MNVLITGGTGLIGTALTRSLLADGHNVAILTRSQPAEPIPNVVYLKWDGESTEGWQEAANNADAVVNLAGAGIGDGRWTEEYKREILASRVNAGRAVTEALAFAATQTPARISGKQRVLVQASAVGYYGTHGDEEISELHPAGDDFLAEVCRAWEASTEEVEALGVRRAVARTGVVFSTQGGALPQILLPFKMIVAGGPIGSGKQYVPWIHIDDEVRALRYLMENENAAGAYNLCAPHAVQNREMAGIIGEVMGRPSLVPTPAFALKAALGERATLVLDGQNQVPARLLAEGFEFTWPALKPALQDLLQREV